MTELDLDAKLDRFDEHAEAAVELLVRWLLDRRRDMVAAARGRHVWGHYRYGNGNFERWGPGQVRAAILEELADGIVYATRYLEMTSGEDPPPR